MLIYFQIFFRLPKKEVLGNKSVKPNLPLPKDYEFLLKVFECIDSVRFLKILYFLKLSYPFTK